MENSRENIYQIYNGEKNLRLIDELGINPFSEDDDYSNFINFIINKEDNEKNKITKYIYSKKRNAFLLKNSMETYKMLDYLAKNAEEEMKRELEIEKEKERNKKKPKKLILG